MKKFFIALLTIGYAYSINGTIIFYDGTTLKGELSSSDTRYVFIIPDGLVMPEKIPVVDIESLNLDNGIILIEDGLAQQTYMDGKFSLIERKESEEVSMADSEEEYEDYSLGNLDYFSISALYEFSRGQYKIYEKGWWETNLVDAKIINHIKFSD